MGKYSLDITLKDKPFINIEVEDDRVLLGAYEDGKIARKLFFINKDELELLINGLMAANTLIHNEVDLSQFIYQGK
jgi:hypothetical protein|nr:MAG TPA: Invasion protein B family [Caudoviricetes sp.]